MKWKIPPIIKIYEALGAVADGRVEVAGDSAKVYSSSRNKYYDVVYDHEKNAIMTNDKGSYWNGYLGYPAIAYLFIIKVLKFDKDLAELLKGIAWKDINQKFKNDFDKTLAHIFSSLSSEQITAMQEYVAIIERDIKKLNLDMLGKKIAPPEGY